MPYPMRPPARRGLVPAVVLLLLAGLSGAVGCSVGGGLPNGRQSTATAQISHSPAAGPSGTSGSSVPGARTPPRTGAAGPEPQAVPAPARPWNVRPASVAALGDSITRGFDACDPLVDCPEVSWATGSRAKVSSLSSRLTGPSAGVPSWNLARSGARVADLPSQARAAAAHRPAMVTVLIGANDACTATTGAMTPVAAFRKDFDAALAYLHRVLPATQVLVASIPDLQRLWSVGRTNVLGKQVWKLGLCPSMLGDADSRTAAAQQRRTAVRNRVIAYNTTMGQVCAHYTRCRYDGGAVFAYQFGTTELSHWDWFHPNEKGEAELARILAGVAGFPARS